MSADKNSNLSKSLFLWFKTIDIPIDSCETINNLSDGVAIALALHKIDSKTFTDMWLSKIKFDTGNNWRLKHSNVKKVCSGAIEYYSECLQLPSSFFRPPNVLAIAEKNNEHELGVLLQLVLGCAVNCPSKQDYITKIMVLEESLQRNIMTALQELETEWQGACSSVKLSTDKTISFTKHIGHNAQEGAIAIDHMLNNTNDALAQRCHDAERKVSLLLDEKFTLQQEMSKLQEELNRGLHGSTVIGEDGVSLGPVQPGSTRFTELRLQLDAMKDELLMAETQRDDFKIRVSYLEREIDVLRQKIDELNLGADQIVILKDENEVLRDSVDRLKLTEQQLNTMKKKLEDYNDLRQQIKILEERNNQYAQQNLSKEEHLKKNATLKNQVEMFKKDIQELHNKLEVEILSRDKNEFDINNMNTRLIALQRENECLLSERDQLRETCDELKCLRQKYIADDCRTMCSELSTEKKTHLEHAIKEERLNYFEHNDLDGENNDDMKVQDDHFQEMSMQRHMISQLQSLLVLCEQDLISSQLRDKQTIDKTRQILESCELKSNSYESLCDMHVINTTNDELLASAFYHLSSSCYRESIEGRLALLNSAGQSFLTRQRQGTTRKTIPGSINRLNK